MIRCTLLPVSAFRYAGKVATSVFPSPVRISAILPSCRAIPPTSCISKCRRPSALSPASRTTAKTSGRISSSVSPSAKRCLNSGVLAASCLSSSAFMSSAKALICLTILPMRFSSRLLRVPKKFFRVWLIMTFHRILNKVGRTIVARSERRAKQDWIRVAYEPHNLRGQLHVHFCTLQNVRADR